MSQVQVIFPPQFEPFQPYLSLPYLKGLLKIHGVDTKCHDLNVDFYWWLFSNYNNHKSPCSGKESFLFSNVDKAIDIIRTRQAQLSDYRWATNLLNEYLSVISPEEIDLSLTYMEIGNRYSSYDLFNYINKPDNIFSQYFNHIKNKLIRNDTKYFLFSLVVLDQFGAALTFAREIKSVIPQAKIVFGGPMVTRFYNRIKEISWINEYVDIIAPGEALHIMPTIFGFNETWTGHVTPDFSDLDLEKYFSPNLVLPYLVAHGCKWGRCTFCSHHLTYDGYRESGINDVARDIIALTKKYGVEYISFCDEYLTTEQLDKLSDIIIREKLNIKWSTFVRAKREFMKDSFTKKLYASGARLLMFGFESASQRIVKLMQKGNNVKRYQPILESCKKANIAVRLDFMVGFPTETEEDAQTTYDFVRENSDLLDTPFSSFSVAVFELREDIPVMADLKRYGIESHALLRGDLDEQYEFIDNKGLTLDQKSTWRNRLISFCKNRLKMELLSPQNKTHQLLFKDFYDQEKLELPVLTIENKRMNSLHGNWSYGVVIDYKADSGIIITNYATGGGIELSRELSEVVRGFENKSNFFSVWITSNIRNETDFSALLNFLYRNDYLEVFNSKDFFREKHRLDLSNETLNIPANMYT